ncbi:NAD(P)/FAD-dependent oxidoreductase [soil metagenome]
MEHPNPRRSEAGILLDAPDAPDPSFTLENANEAQLVQMLADAHLPSLLVALAFLTGDYSFLADQFRPPTVSISLGMDPTGGLSPEAQMLARAKALDALLAFRDAGSVPAAPPTPDQLVALMQFITGPVDEANIPLMIHELGLPSDLGAPDWTLAEIAPGREFRVAIIGAGLSGIAAAHRVSQAGLDFEIFERADDLGGVWLANSYPGARLDTSNFAYSYSFSQSGEWTNQYSPREAVLGYLNDVAEQLQLKSRIQFSTRVLSATFDDESCTWTVVTHGPGGSTTSGVFDAVISAVGQLNTPNIPDIPGAETFHGPSWHTAEWNHDVDLAGKRVAVIGTGASAFQVIPPVAREAASLTVFQRTPAWVLPTKGYTSLLPDGLHWLFQNVPNYHRFYRFSQFWQNVDGIRHLAVVDPAWEHPVSISEKNEAMRASIEASMRATFAAKPDLADKLVPQYPPFAKRTVRDDGTWSSALLQDNVSVVTENIARITEDGIETADGEFYPLDVIIYGTGFRASEFLSTVEVSGRHGESLDEYWKGDARAYFGTTIPHFPNLFMLYGPNTNLNVNGSVVLFIEASVEYALACIKSLLEGGHRAMEIRDEPYLAYNQRVDAASKTLAIGYSSVNSWYKNKFGRVSQNWPLSTLEFWSGTRKPADGDYDYL